jgi:hypothetical protein
VGRAFTVCGKKRTTVILSADPARRIPLSLYVLNREVFFAPLRMTTKALFPQPIYPPLPVPWGRHCSRCKPCLTAELSRAQEEACLPGRLLRGEPPPMRKTQGVAPTVSLPASIPGPKSELLLRETCPPQAGVSNLDLWSMGRTLPDAKDAPRAPPFGKRRESMGHPSRLKVFLKAFPARGAAFSHLGHAAMALCRAHAAAGARRDLLR